MKFKEPLSHFQSNFAQSSLGFTNKDHSIIKNEMMGFFPSPNQSFDIFELVSRVSDVAHVPLVILVSTFYLKVSVLRNM